MIDLKKYPEIKNNLDLLGLCSTLEEFVNMCGYDGSEEIQKLLKTNRNAFWQFLKDQTKGKVIRDYESQGISLKYTPHGMTLQEDWVNEIFDRLKRSLELARATLKLALGYAQAQAKPGVNDKLFEEVLQTHFHLGTDSYRSGASTKIIRVFTLTASGLDGRVRISSSTKLPNAAGYVSLKKEGKSEGSLFHNRLSEDLLTSEDRKEATVIRGSIHMSFKSLSPRGSVEYEKAYSELEIARILIHEATHKFANTADKAYCHEEDKYKKLTVEESLQNADSYSFAAISFANKQLYTSESPDLRQAKIV